MIGAGSLAVICFALALWLVVAQLDIGKVYNSDPVSCHAETTSPACLNQCKCGWCQGNGSDSECLGRSDREICLEFHKNATWDDTKTPDCVAQYQATVNVLMELWIAITCSAVLATVLVFRLIAVRRHRRQTETTRLLNDPDPAFQT